MPYKDVWMHCVKPYWLCKIWLCTVVLVGALAGSENVGTY